MDSLKNLREKLDKLDSLLGQLKTSHARVRQLKRSVYVLRALLKEENAIKSPYGPVTAIARFSIQ
jgi:hypothetical protein